MKNGIVSVTVGVGVGDTLVDNWVVLGWDDQFVCGPMR